MEGLYIFLNVLQVVKIETATSFNIDLCFHTPNLFETIFRVLCWGGNGSQNLESTCYTFSTYINSFHPHNNSELHFHFTNQRLETDCVREKKQATELISEFQAPWHGNL